MRAQLFADDVEQQQTAAQEYRRKQHRPRRDFHLARAVIDERAPTGRRCLHAETQKAQKRFDRSEEHTSELQSLMRISYAVFCLKKKKQQPNKTKYTVTTQTIT